MDEKRIKKLAIAFAKAALVEDARVKDGFDGQTLCCICMAISSLMHDVFGFAMESEPYEAEEQYDRYTAWNIYVTYEGITYRQELARRRIPKERRYTKWDCLDPDVWTKTKQKR